MRPPICDETHGRKPPFESLEGGLGCSAYAPRCRHVGPDVRSRKIWHTLDIQRSLIQCESGAEHKSLVPAVSLVVEHTR